jgi:hypothetical protein
VMNLAMYILSIWTVKMRAMISSITYNKVDLDKTPRQPATHKNTYTRMAKYIKQYIKCDSTVILFHY